MTEPPRIVQTADGSITCFDEETGELYHNRASAIAEALTNFVKPSGICELAQKQDLVSILDVPFGLGYNTLVLLQELLSVEKRTIKVIEVTAIEIDSSVVQLVEQVLTDGRFDKLRKSIGDGGTALSEVVRAVNNFSRTEFKLSQFNSNDLLVRLQLYLGDMRKIVPQLMASDHRFDAIMHDAFSPNKMPELWTADLFKIYRQMLNRNGRISTYSVAVAVRAGLLESGLSVYATSGVGAKSGGTVAIVGALDELPEGIFSLNTEERLRLEGRSGVPYRDQALTQARSDIRRLRAHEQETV